jgi:prepilin-type processing-associated H-X9-DG protein
MSTRELIVDDVLIISDVDGPETVDELLIILDDTAPSRPAQRRRRRLTPWIVGAGILVPLIWIASLALREAFHESWRSQCAGNLRRLGAAMLEYQEAHTQFPAPASIGREGRQLLSWRVAILPQFGYQSLYEKFHLDEPWDSPHNRTLLAEMPPEFRCPAAAGRGPGETGFVVIVGPETDAYNINTPFTPTHGADIRHITHGTSNTFLVLETDRSIPWTMPDDAHWTEGGAAPRLASPHAGGSHALFADGSVRFIKVTVSLQTLVMLLTMNGGEVIGGG